MNKRTDTERINWLEKNEESLYKVVVEKRRMLTDNSGTVEVYSEFVGWSVGSRLDECQTVREAIDKGMDNGR